MWREGECIRKSAYKRQKQSLQPWKLEEIRSLGSWFRGMKATHTKKQLRATIRSEQMETSKAQSVSEYVFILTSPKAG